MSWKKRKIGRSLLEIVPLVFGGNVFGWTIDQTASFSLLDAFISAGFNFIDTADMYSTWAPGNQGGESETIIGNWLHARRNRNQVILSTKVGMEMGPGKRGLSHSYIRKSIDASLKRLKTDYVDLYFAHEDDLQTPIEETLEAFTSLIKQGKVRAIGASNFTGERFNQSLFISKESGFARYECLQPLYNLCERKEYETSLEKICVDNHIGVVPYFSLASGFLTGKYRSEKDFGKSPRGGWIEKYMNEKGMKILRALDEVAAEHRATPAQIALAWLLARPSITAPIVSATNRAQLDEILKSTQIHLNPKAIHLLNEASA